MQLQCNMRHDKAVFQAYLLSKGSDWNRSTCKKVRLDEIYLRAKYEGDRRNIDGDIGDLLNCGRRRTSGGVGPYLKALRYVT